jgi:mono/diheme cytochrome c family protein
VTRLLNFSLRKFKIYVVSLVPALLLCACDQKAPKTGDPVAGREMFERGCAVCHLADSTKKKVGPGLSGLYRLKLLPDGTPVTDENVERWIRNGGGLMPGFKNAISPEQMRDLIAYLKTL